jgi:hypothetical protein
MNIRRLEQRETTGPNKSVISFSSRSHSHSGTGHSHLSTLGIESFEGHVRMEENSEQLRLETLNKGTLPESDDLPRAVPAASDVKDTPQVGPLQWEWITPLKAVYAFGMLTIIVVAYMSSRCRRV